MDTQQKYFDSVQMGMELLAKTQNYPLQSALKKYI